MDIEHAAIERTHQTGKKNKSRSWPIVAQKKWQEVLTNREKGIISYLNYRTVLSVKKEYNSFFYFSSFFLIRYIVILSLIIQLNFEMR